MSIKPQEIRSDFPILGREVHPGVPLVYLDSTATTQKPGVVLEAMQKYYRYSNANIHRGVHTLAEEATGLYENARKKVAAFINSPSAAQVIFTKNATEAINLVAYAWARNRLKRGDLIILTEMEHHSNLVPWQMISKDMGLEMEFIPVTPAGLLDLDRYKSLLEKKPRLVAFTHMSNVLGTINPAKELVELAHQAGAITLIDGAQSVPHLPVDVQDLDADFLAFSAHKMLGPTGIGVLYGRRALLEDMPPFLGGGDMIKSVHLVDFEPNELPHKFEAGTPPIAEAIGFHAAIQYLEVIGMDVIAAHEQEIIRYAIERLEEVPALKVFGPEARYKGAVAAFALDGIHPHDVAQILDRYGIAVRAGHHCAQPLHEKLNIPATTRASFYIYSSTQEVDRLIDALYEVKKIFH